MGRISGFNDDEKTTVSNSPPLSLSEALLFTTMSIVGLPVEVHIKDGSIFSGIFHTACFDKGYGVALKKARMIRKGTHNANVANGGLIDTLVVLPGDLVQVVAKGVMLPYDGVSSIGTCDEEEAIPEGSEDGTVSSTEEVNQERQVEVGRPREEEDGYCQHSESLKEVHEVHGSSRILNGSHAEVNGRKENQAFVAPNQLANESACANDASTNVSVINRFHDSHLAKEFMRNESIASEVSDYGKSDSDMSRGTLLPTEMAPQNPVSNRTFKESKLNPGAKVFSPSFPNFRSTPPPLVSTVPSMAYVPNSIPVIQVATAQPEVGMRPLAARSSWPVKFVPFVNSTAMNVDNSLQYTQPIAGHIAARAQTTRHGAQYQPIQAVPPPYVHPTQNGMFGRPGQLVYVHPVTHDVIQGPAALSQPPHPLLSSHQIHVPKHEGVLGGQALQVSVPRPLVTNGPQPFAVPSHIQPLFSAMLPHSILGSNVPFSAKFP